jgi:phenylalanyl-tRNA synthetase beta chain
VSDATWHRAEAEWLHPRSATRVDQQGRTLGVFGELHPDVAARYDLEGPPVFVAELDLDAIAKVRGGLPRFEPLPTLPPAQRDLSFFLGEDVDAGEVIRVIREAGPETLEDVSLFDVYTGKGVPEGKKSLAVALTFRAADRTLTDGEVEGFQAAIIEALTGRLGADVRTG